MHARTTVAGSRSSSYLCIVCKSHRYHQQLSCTKANVPPGISYDIVQIDLLCTGTTTACRSFCRRPTSSVERAILKLVLLECSIIVLESNPYIPYSCMVWYQLPYLFMARTVKNHTNTTNAAVAHLLASHLLALGGIYGALLLRRVDALLHRRDVFLKTMA